MSCPTVEAADKLQTEGKPITCTYGERKPGERKLAPFEALVMKLTVRVEEPPGTKTTLENSATVEGGGAPRVNGLK